MDLLGAHSIAIIIFIDRFIMHILKTIEILDICLLDPCPIKYLSMYAKVYGYMFLLLTTCECTSRIKCIIKLTNSPVNNFNSTVSHLWNLSVFVILLRTTYFK